jgi:hypothetical protein
MISVLQPRLMTDFSFDTDKLDKNDKHYYD